MCILHRYFKQNVWSQSFYQSSLAQFSLHVNMDANSYLLSKLILFRLPNLYHISISSQGKLVRSVPQHRCPSHVSKFPKLKVVVFLSNFQI